MLIGRKPQVNKNQYKIMAVNFKLLDKSTLTPVSLISVDEEICTKVLQAPIHPIFWGGDGENSFNWYDSIGFMLASGLKLEDEPSEGRSVRAYYQQSKAWHKELPIIEKVIDYLQSNYVSISWGSWGTKC